MTPAPQPTIEEASAERLRLRPSDVPIPSESILPDAKLWAGDPRFLQKGGDCFVCGSYLEPGTPMRDVVWCPRHYFRCRACDPGASPLVPGRERGERGRSCTCTSTLLRARVRATAVEIEVSKAGTAVSFTLSAADGTGTVRWWVPGKALTQAQAKAIVTQLGFPVDGP